MELCQLLWLRWAPTLDWNGSRAFVRDRLRFARCCQSPESAAELCLHRPPGSRGRSVRCFWGIVSPTGQRVLELELVKPPPPHGWPPGLWSWAFTGPHRSVLITLLLILDLSPFVEILDLNRARWNNDFHSDLGPGVSRKESVPRETVWANKQIQTCSQLLCRERLQLSTDT